MKTDNPDTDRLLPALQRGDPIAFETLCRELRVYVTTVALNRLRNYHDAEEIVSETFLRAHRGLPTFRGECSIKTWLHRIATNIALNRYWYYHRRRRDVTLSLDMPMGESADPFHTMIAADDPDHRDEIEGRELECAVSAAMPGLNPRHAMALRLRLQNLSYEEIADHLGVKIGTVKSRIARARECLRANLNQEHAA